MKRSSLRFQRWRDVLSTVKVLSWNVTIAPRLSRISRSRWTSEISGTFVSSAVSKRRVLAMSGRAAFLEPLTLISPRVFSHHVIVYILMVM